MPSTAYRNLTPGRSPYPTPSPTVSPPGPHKDEPGEPDGSVSQYNGGNMSIIERRRGSNDRQTARIPFPECLETLREAVSDIEPYRSMYSAPYAASSLQIDTSGTHPPVLGEPLFLPDDMDAGVIARQPSTGAKQTDVREQDDIEFTGSAPSLAMVRMTNDTERRVELDRQVANSSLSRRRALSEDDDDDDFEVTGQIIRTKYARRCSSSSRLATPLRETSEQPAEADGICNACGCTCRRVSGRGSGTGSTVLTLSQRANLLRLLLGEGLSFHQQLIRLGAEFTHWSDVAVHIGATARDFDRVRHAAKWFQDQLPWRIRSGRL